MDIDKLELIAAAGGYVPRTGMSARLTPVEMHALDAALVASDHPDAPRARAAVTAMRRWLVHGGTEAPPVRGGSFVRSDGEVWIAYTGHPSPAIIRGRRSVLEDLHRFLAVATHANYDGSAGVKTKPPVTLAVPEAGAGAVSVRSSLGSLTLDVADTLTLSQWLAASIRRGDRKVAVCLPGGWQAA